MPLIKSAKKALRVSEKKAEKNRLIKAKIKDALKGARIAIEKKEKDIDKKISKAYRELDIATKKNLIHKNRASRLKSRLSKRANIQ